MPLRYKVSEVDQKEPLTSMFDLLPRESQLHFWQRPDILGCQQKEAIKFYMLCAIRFYFLVLTLFHWTSVLVLLNACITFASRKGTMLLPSVTSKVLEKWFLSPPSLPFIGFVLSFFPVQMSTFKAYIQLSKYWNSMQALFNGSIRISQHSYVGHESSYWILNWICFKGKLYSHSPKGGNVCV